MSFREVFGHEPEVVWQAPGRVNLIGDHTDYNQGLVLPLAIAQATTVGIRVTNTGALASASAQYGSEVAVAEIDDLVPSGGHWSRYVEGAVWLLANHGVKLDGLEVFVDSSVPAGAGLSSSAALTCATLSAILEATDTAWPPDQVAVAARQVENDYVGAPVGIMDPMVVMNAAERTALFLDCRTFQHELVELDPTAARAALATFDTGQQHQTAGATYARRVEECRSAANELGVDSLRDVTDMHRVAHLSDATLAARARHVVTENGRVREAVHRLQSADLEGVGRLMTASHTSLRDDYQVSTPELDLLVSAANTSGAFGARMTGAGMGGAAIVLCPQAVVESIAHRVAEAFEQAGYRKPVRMDVEPSAGAHTHHG